MRHARSCPDSTSATTNQPNPAGSPLKAPAAFPFTNTNDLLGGLERIAREQNEFYLLGYVPASSPEGSCHIVESKNGARRHASSARAAAIATCVPPIRLTAGPFRGKWNCKPREAQPGAIHGSLQAPFFYSAPKHAQVNLAMEIPGDSVIFNKERASITPT